MLEREHEGLLRERKKNRKFKTGKSLDILVTSCRWSHKYCNYSGTRDIEPVPRSGKSYQYVSMMQRLLPAVKRPTLIRKIVVPYGRYDKTGRMEQEKKMVDGLSAALLSAL